MSEVIEPKSEPPKDESPGCLMQFIGATISGIALAIGYQLAKHFFGR